MARPPAQASAQAGDRWVLVTLEKASVGKRGVDEAGFRLLYNAALDAGSQGDVQLLLRWTGGKVDRVCSAMALTYNLALHLGEVSGKASADGVNIEVNLEVNGDKFAPPTKAQYSIQLQERAGKFSGMYEGRFGGAEVKGSAAGEAVNGYERISAASLQAGEHPRLVFRKAELETIRKRAQTQEGQEVVARLRTWLELGKGGKFGYRSDAPPYSEGSFAAGHALLWALTGEAAEAEHARRVTKIAMGFSGGEWGGWARGFILVGVAHAYDLCYDAWDEAFRKEVAEYLAQRAKLKTASVDATWDAMFNSAAGMAALAILGDAEDVGGAAEGALEQVEHFVFWHRRIAVGEKGFLCETVNNTEVLHNLLPLLHAMRVGLGRDWAKGSGYEWIIANTMMSRGRFFGNDAGDEWWPVLAFEGLFPNDWRAALKWQFQQSITKRGFLKDPIYGMALPHHALYFFVNYPFSIEAHDPNEMDLPLSMEDKKFGGYVLRSGWTENDVVVTVRAQTNAPRASVQAGAFTVSGLGLKPNLMGGARPSGGLFTLATVNNLEERPSVARVEGAIPMRGGRVTHAKLEEDGSGVVTMEQDLWVDGDPWGYLKSWGFARNEGSVLGLMSGRHAVRGEKDLGIKVTRSIGVDFSGRSGSPCLIAVADRFSGGGGREKYVQYSLGSRASFGMRLDEGFFVMSQTVKGAEIPNLLTGTFVAPSKVKLSTGADAAGPHQLQARGGDSYFVVMTIQKGASPVVEVEGSGMEAKARVGKRVVRIEGGNVVFE